MQAFNPPWALLLSQLRRSDDARLSEAALTATGADVERLVRSKLLRRANNDYEPPECVHRCTPNLDHNSRQKEGLVGVACPHDVACWPGWTWVPRSEVESLRCQSKDVLAALSRHNGLEPIGLAVPPPFVPVGLLRRRGLAVPVVWLRSARRGFDSLCRGLRAHLGLDALIVLVAKEPKRCFSAAERIQVLRLEVTDDGDLGLVHALDELTPEYRSTVVDDPELDLDYVKLRFAHQEGRHQLYVNGHLFGAFQRSDLKFLRLLLLAAARKSRTDDGWLDKARLRGGDDKDRDLEKLRIDLSKYEVPELSEPERKALIKSRKGTGTIRLAVPPENLVFDASLAELQFVGPDTTTKRSGQRGKVTQDHEDGLQNAATLLRDSRRLGAPGDPEAVKTPTKRRSSRSAP